jgi:transposase
MAKPLSIDLRERVVAAVSGGLSRRQAAERFGVSAASAVRWCSLEREQGDAKPKPMGGDRYSHRIEAHAVVILRAVDDKPDVTLEELRALLADHGFEASISAIWRFFARRGVTWKKRLRTRANKSALTS